MFKKIEIQDWKHINKVEINFHPKLTIVTGANGSGKSTIIRILARHFGWGLAEYGTPARDEKTGSMFYYPRKLLSKWLTAMGKTDQQLGQSIGRLQYENGNQEELRIPVGQSAPQYQIDFNRQSEMKGLFIPAHRPVFVHSAIQHISTKPIEKNQAFSQVRSSSQNVYTGGSSSSGKSIKETMLNWMLHGYGNQLYAAHPLYKKLFEDFQEKLSKVLPKSIGFKKFEPRESDLVLICDSGEYTLEACSGGITALIELTWQIFTYDDGSKFSVVIDEIENHLHPSLQRSVLNDLMSAFPNAQFIVSTHSPFVVGSAKESFVYALSFSSDDHRVSSQKLELVDKASTASEILKQVLGVPLTIPIWAENEISEIVSKYEKEPFSAETIERLANELRNKKLDHLVSASISQFLDKRKV